MPLDAVQKIIRDSICPGCRTYEVSSDCIIRPIFNGVLCPCSSCLIKIICTKRCEKLQKYTGYLTKKEKKI